MNHIIIGGNRLFHYLIHQIIQGGKLLWFHGFLLTANVLPVKNFHPALGKIP